jgi:hypothetical protein
MVMARQRKKNSLVENMNRRKRAGTSRSKAKSTVSKDAYEQMQKGWPRKKRRASRRAKR